MDLFLLKIYDKRDDFDFDMLNFPFLDGDVPRRDSNGVYISLITQDCHRSLIFVGILNKTIFILNFALPLKFHLAEYFRNI